MPRSSPYPKPIAEKVKKLIDEITPYYKPEALSAFQKILRDKESLRVKITDVKITGEALKNNVKSFEVAIIESKGPAKQLYCTTTDVARELEGLLQRGLKVYVTLHITFKKTKIEEDEEVFEFTDAYFNSNTFTITNSDQIIDALDRASEEIKNKVAVWLLEGSGQTIEVILGHYIDIAKYVPLRGNSYLPLPEELRNSKKGLINLTNNDKCFLWCHVRHLNPQKKYPERIKLSDREFAKKLDYSGITFLVTINQIDGIEKQNQINISVFGYDKSVFPIRISRENYDDHLELLYIEGEESSGSKQHYVNIKNFNSLMYSFTDVKVKKTFLHVLFAMLLFK